MACKGVGPRTDTGPAGYHARTSHASCLARAPGAWSGRAPPTRSEIPMGTAIEAIRNIAFVGHPSAGKTTLVDALAYEMKVVDKRPSVAEKRSLCDTEPEEQEKGHTLQMSLVQVRQEGVEYTFIDTPGYPDFMADAQSSMVASDLVI